MIVMVACFLLQFVEGSSGRGSQPGVDQSVVVHEVDLSQ